MDDAVELALLGRDLGLGDVDLAEVGALLRKKLAWLGFGALSSSVWLSPHDIELRYEPNGSTREAQIERIVRLGFEIRVDLVRDDGERLYAQLTRDEADELELARGDIVYVRTRKERTFNTEAEPAARRP